MPPPDGTDLRDTGMAAAEDAQERAAPGWPGRAYQAIVAVAKRQSTVHVDDVLAIFPERPVHHNAAGQVWMSAARNGVIKRGKEWRHSRDRRKHKHLYPVYQSLIYRAEAP